MKNSDSNNALAVHVKQSSHNMQWKEASVVTREGHWIKWKIKEGIVIINNLNMTRVPNFTKPHT